jgi:hypothetical protein
MERLAVSEHPANGFLPERVFYLCPADSIEDLGQKIGDSSVNFALFLAMNANGFADSSVVQGAKKLLSKGLASLCTWGPDSRHPQKFRATCGAPGAAFHLISPSFENSIDSRWIFFLKSGKVLSPVSSNQPARLYL